MQQKRLGVVLFQLGGPDSLHAVEPFLYNLFSDPDIIDFPLARLARQPLARLIAANRAKKVQHHYASIGGRSPLPEITERQAQALEAELRLSLDARVVVAMRYWRPFTADAIRRLQAERVEELVLLPLYPQYSSTTTGSSLREWNRVAREHGLNGLPSQLVREFYDHPGYLDALVAQIARTLERFDPTAEVHLVFSAHNVPTSVIAAGDPYRSQIEATMRLILGRGAWSLPAHLCYQSKVGGARWLEPTLDHTIRRLAAEGAQNLLVIPIAFVSDHVETLGEIDIEARAAAARCGIAQFEMMPGLNDSPRFIRALADLVRATRAVPALCTPAV
ncbi:MAG TPA: ferrochelatase [Bryobacterales bacterium]|nr:ferrochelatase [Bryobacterales bacterium]